MYKYETISRYIITFLKKNKETGDAMYNMVTTVNNIVLHI